MPFYTPFFTHQAMRRSCIFFSMFCRKTWILQVMNNHYYNLAHTTCKDDFASFKKLSQDFSRSCISIFANSFQVMHDTSGSSFETTHHDQDTLLINIFARFCWYSEQIPFCHWSLKSCIFLQNNATWTQSCLKASVSPEAASSSSFCSHCFESIFEFPLFWAMSESWNFIHHRLYM